VKNSEIWRIWFTKNCVTFLEILARFYVQNPLSVLPTKRGTAAKTWHVFTVSGLDSAFQKVRFSLFRS